MQSLGYFFILFAIGFLNGFIRGVVYGPLIGDEFAHPISSITAIILFTIAIYVFLKKTSADYELRDLIIVGLVWVSLTVLVEFLMGHYLLEHPWESLIADYNIFAGRTWPYVLIWIAISPYLLGRFLIKKE